MLAQKGGKILVSTIKCQNCGAEVDSNFVFCDQCGERLERTEALSSSLVIKSSQNSDRSITVDRKETKMKKSPASDVFYVFAVICIIAALVCFYHGYDKMYHYANSEYTYGEHINAYFKADFYNYNINANYAISFFVLGIGNALMGFLSLSAGFILNQYLTVSEENTDKLIKAMSNHQSDGNHQFADKDILTDIDDSSDLPEL
jgi:hypothetical protein